MKGNEYIRCPGLLVGSMRIEWRGYLGVVPKDHVKGKCLSTEYSVLPPPKVHTMNSV